MNAYSKGITKEQFVAEMYKHQAADNFIKGVYGDYGEKGCAVGCGIQSIINLNTNENGGIFLSRSDHKSYETYLGIPEWLAKVEDSFFEGVSVERSKTWPVEFAKAINSGADLNKIKKDFIIYILKQNIKTQKENLKNNPELKDIIEEVIRANIQTIALYRQESAAWSAWSAARSAAESAARSAAWSAAGSAAFEKYADKLLKLIKGCK